MLNNLTLLLIEPDPKERVIFNKLIGTKFKSIQFANNVVSGLKIFHKDWIDIIITNIEMPGETLNALNLIEYIRHKNINIPIIILTEQIDTPLGLRALNMEIDGYIIKPVNLLKLESAIIPIIKNLYGPQKKAKIGPNIYYCSLQKTLHIHEKKIRLGCIESNLIELLLANKISVSSKLQIINLASNDLNLKNLLISWVTYFDNNQNNTQTTTPYLLNQFNILSGAKPIKTI